MAALSCGTCGLHIGMQVLICPGCGSVQLAGTGGHAPESRPAPVPEPDRGGWYAAPGGPDIRLVFAWGEVDLPRGTESVIGRDPASPAFDLLADREAVSRCHARIGVDEQGEVWIADEGSVNGTYLDGWVLRPGERVPVHDGAALRLAADVEGVVRIRL